MAASTPWQEKRRPCGVCSRSGPVQHHPHIHRVIPAGGLSPDHQHWIHPRYPFFLPVNVLSRVSRQVRRRFERHFSATNVAVSWFSKIPGKGQKHSGLFCDCCSATSGSFVRNAPSEDLNTYSSIWRVTLIGSPSPTHRVTQIADGQVTFRWKVCASR